MKTRTEICLSPGCALCAGRRLANDPRGGDTGNPGVAAAPEPEAGG